MCKKKRKYSKKWYLIKEGRNLQSLESSGRDYDYEDVPLVTFTKLSSISDFDNDNDKKQLRKGSE